jgi:hypothetical protein
MKRSERLKAAKELLLTNGCTGVLAKDSKGKEVSPFNLEACSFCAIGALVKVNPALNEEDFPSLNSFYEIDKVPDIDFVLQCWNENHPEDPETFLFSLNDKYDSNDILTAFNLAIEKAEQIEKVEEWLQN